MEKTGTREGVSPALLEPLLFERAFLPFSSVGHSPAPLL